MLSFSLHRHGTGTDMKGIPSDLSSDGLRREASGKMYSSFTALTEEDISVERVLYGRFIRGHLLGQGSFGSVYEAYDSESRSVVALKVCQVNRKKKSMVTQHAAAFLEPEQQMRREVQTLQRLPRSPFIVDFLGQVQMFGNEISSSSVVSSSSSSSSSLTMCVATSLVRGASLHALVEHGGALCATQTRAVVWRVMRALQHLKSNGIVHHDVKPENVLVSFSRRRRNNGVNNSVAKSRLEERLSDQHSDDQSSHHTTMQNANGQNANPNSAPLFASRSSSSNEFVAVNNNNNNNNNANANALSEDEWDIDVRLADFGCACEVEECNTERMKDLAALSPAFQSPEVVAATAGGGLGTSLSSMAISSMAEGGGGDVSRSRSNSASVVELDWFLLEMWSAGIIAYFTHVGSYPFNFNDGILTLLDQIGNLEYDRSKLDDDLRHAHDVNNLSAQVAHLITSLLTRAEDRLNLEQALGHSFFHGYCGEDNAHEDEQWKRLPPPSISFVDGVDPMVYMRDPPKGNGGGGGASSSSSKSLTSAHGSRGELQNSMEFGPAVIINPDGSIKADKPPAARQSRSSGGKCCNIM